METYRILSQGKEIANKINLANTFTKRLKGLLGKKNLDEGEGILIHPCNQIHTFGMKFDIDLLFISTDNEILYIEKAFSPGQVSRKVPKASKVLEVKSGTIEAYDIEINQKIRLL